MISLARKNQNNTLFSKRMYSLKKDRNFDKFYDYLGVSKATFSRFLSGQSSPTADQLWEFVLRYAADHEMKMIDLNWLLNDNDRREGPIFTNAPTAAKETEQ